MNTGVTKVETRSDDYGLEVEVRIVRTPLLLTPPPPVADIPPDIRAALLAWLTEEESR